MIKKLLPVLAILVFMGAGCSSSSTVSQSPSTSANITAEETATQPESTKLAEGQLQVQPVDCKTDQACADDIWVRCAPGVFDFGQKGMLIAMVKIEGKAGNGCQVTWNYTEDYLKQGGQDGERYKGKNMTCIIQSTETSATAAFGNYIKAQATTSFAGCDGALKDVLTQPVTGPATLRD